MIRERATGTRPRRAESGGGPRGRKGRERRRHPEVPRPEGSARTRRPGPRRRDGRRRRADAGREAAAATRRCVPLAGRRFPQWPTSRPGVVRGVVTAGTGRSGRATGRTVETPGGKGPDLFEDPALRLGRDEDGRQEGPLPLEEERPERELVFDLGVRLPGVASHAGSAEPGRLGNPAERQVGLQAVDARAGEGDVVERRDHRDSRRGGGGGEVRNEAEPGVDVEDVGAEAPEEVAHERLAVGAVSQAFGVRGQPFEPEDGKTGESSSVRRAGARPRSEPERTKRLLRGPSAPTPRPPRTLPHRPGTRARTRGRRAGRASRAS